MSTYSKPEFKEKLKEAQEAFKSFGKLELQGRKYMRRAILGCYDIYLHYNDKLIRKQCRRAEIKYIPSKPMKMILMLAMGITDECDDERTKARIRTYVRVLKYFDCMHYDLNTAGKNLDQYGIDYFANPRLKEQAGEEEWEDDEKQLSLDYESREKTEDDETDDEIEDDESDEEEEDKNVVSSSHTKKLSLSGKVVEFFRENEIKDKAFVIWVTDGEAYICKDFKLFDKLENFDFEKMK